MSDSTDQEEDQIALPAALAGSGQLDRLVETARSDARQALSENTLRAYAKDWSRFARRCRNPARAPPSRHFSTNDTFSSRLSRASHLDRRATTASPQGKFTLQVLGAAAEFERALIRERTKVGLASARTKGRVGGNPGLRVRDPEALRKVRLARADGYVARLDESAQDWVPHVRRLRPDMPWEDVLCIVNAPLPEVQRWTQARMVRAVNANVRDGFRPETVLGRAARRDTDDRLPAIVAAIKGADPDVTLKSICDRLEAMRERTPRGRSGWQPSSVRMLLERAAKLGLITTAE